VGAVTLVTLDSPLIVGQPTFSLSDADGDGRFTRGDVLMVEEDEPGRFTETPAAPVTVEVWAESDGRVSPLGQGLRWVP
jgi:hypothetical protein